MNEWVSKWMSERASDRTNEQTNERTNAFLVAVWTPIRYVTLQFRDRVGASSLRYKNSAEITVLMWEQRLYLVWMDGRTNEGTNEGTNAFRVALWTPIRYVTLHFRARHGPASLRYLCENRRPILYGFHAGAKAIWHIKSEYGLRLINYRNHNGHYRTQTGLTTTKQQLTNFIPQGNCYKTAYSVYFVSYHCNSISFNNFGCQ